MASTKVRGITIELGADTTGLSKALNGVNKEIGKTQKDLKDVEKLLKLDPSNTELLAQKQRLLSDRVEETKTKLDALKQAQESIDMSTEDGQRQYDALTREITFCENELKNAETAANSFNVTAEKIATTADKVGQKLGTWADKTRGLSMAATGALAGLAGMAVKAAQDADELNTLSKQTGLTTDEIQKMQYASDLIDVDTDTIISGMKKLKKGLDKNKDTFKKMGVEVKTWNGEYRDTSDIFYDVIQVLSEIPNETERDIVAMEIFGKSADELAGIIDDGGKAFRELSKEAENLGVIIPEEQIQKANEFNDSINRLKAQGSATLMELGAEVSEMILPYLPQIQEFIQNILAKIREIDPETLKIIGAVTGIMAVLSPVLSVLSSVSNVISGIAKVAPGVASSVSGALSSVGTFLTTDISTLLSQGGATAGLTYATALVGSAVAFLAGAEIGKQIGAYLFPDDAELYEHYSGIEGTFEMLKDLGDSLVYFFGMAWDDMFRTADASWQKVKDVFNTAINFIKTTWDNSWGMMKNTFNSIWDAIKKTFTDSINRFIAGLNKVSSGISGITGGAINFGHIEYMADGGVLTSGTAIVGEAGPELVQVSDGRAMVQPLNGDSDISALLATYLPYLAAGNQLVLDSGALVGGIAPDMNVALGTLAIRGGRR